MSGNLKPVVGYIRMSTDRQENSPDRQRRKINGLAEREGYRITKWYEDHGLTGTESANYTYRTFASTLTPPILPTPPTTFDARNQPVLSRRSVIRADG